MSGYVGLSQLKKQKLEAAGSSGAVQALRMENAAPVVGPDAPTANSKMVKLDIATTRTWGRPTFGLPVIRQPSLGTNSECRIHFGGPIHVTVLNHNINANWVWRSRELEDQARKDGLIYLAKCWVYKRRHPGGQNGNPG
jgi:hypothetical protein